MVREMLRTFWGDGSKLFRFLPAVSVTYTILKALEIPVPIRDWSYAWALLPVLIWVAVAYIYRWRDSERLEKLITPRIKLGFDPAKCIRDVYLPKGVARYVSVTVNGQEHVPIHNVSVYLHSIEYVDANESLRINIEGSPALEWTRTGGPVHAFEPRTLHAGREALVNVVNCSSVPFPADIYVCSPEQLRREQGAMSVEGTYRITIRASGDGAGAFAELVLKIAWDGQTVESLQAEPWHT